MEAERRDRWVAGGGVAAMSVVAWAWLAHLAHRPHVGESMGGAGAAHVMPWGPGDLGAAFVMWAVMMVAMMLPSAAPMIGTFAGISRRRAARVAVPTVVFVAGYV